MRRALYALAAVLLLLVVAGSALWYFAYGVGTAPPREATVEGLSRPVDIRWSGAGVATIRADSLADQYAALGYAHGTGRPWLASLWRQTATGRLGEWYGAHTLPLDRLARRLGFAELARQTYASLPDADQRLLRAYAAGMNAALGGRAVQNRNEFALLDQSPAPWEPWHTLAVERLYAYLASRPPTIDTLATADSLAPAGSLAPVDSLPAADTARTAVPVAASARRFVRADSSLRRWLSLHDFHHSAAWAARDSSSTHLFYRHVYGASAIPPLQSVLFERPGASDVAALSLPGTPFLVAGRAGRRAWALLPAGQPLDVVRAAYDTSAAPQYERVLGADGTEHLLTVRRSEEALLLSDVPAPDPQSRRALAAARDSALATTADAEGAPTDTAQATGRVDSLWQVRWQGFQPGTDLRAWQALAQDGASPEGGSSFRLLQAGGLTADSSGSFQVFGSPARAIRFEDGLVAGGAPDWTPFLAAQIEARLRQRETSFPASEDDGSASSEGGIQPEQWIQADSSTWAGQLAPDLLASVDSLSRTQRGTFTYEERTDAFGRAVRYLRNWNFSYDEASIGASIFDTWAALYRERTGRLPLVRASVDSLAASDSLRSIEDRRRFQLLSDAVSRLVRQHGEDVEQWRWETVAPDVRRFPGWSDSLAGGRLQALAQTRYAPIDLPGGGHLTTLHWGDSPINRGLPAPAAYEAWLSTDRWQTLFVRRRRFDTRTPFGRYRAQRRDPDPLALRVDSSAAARTTRLVPAGTTGTVGAVRAQF